MEQKYKILRNQALKYTRSNKMWKVGCFYSAL